MKKSTLSEKVKNENAIKVKENTNNINRKKEYGLNVNQAEIEKIKNFINLDKIL
jgi:predicted RNA-binding protein YlqC (UPF0109 family)